MPAAPQKAAAGFMAGRGFCRPMVRWLAGALVVALLLAGCGAKPPAPATAPPTATPTAPLDMDGPVRIVALDGRWSFDEAPARDLVAQAWSASPDAIGAGVRREALLSGEHGAAAATLLALDVAALRTLGVEASADGALVLTRALAGRLGAREGDVLRASADAWPPSRVQVAWEMENVRACAPENLFALCILPAEGDGETRLRLRMDPGADAIRFLADTVELGADDFPAYWNGTFLSPSNASTPFTTAALARTRALPPGRVDGDIEAGEWTIRYRMEVKGERWPGAVAGAVTYHARGFAPFEFDLLNAGDARAQLAAALANATTAPPRELRVARVVDALPLGGDALVSTRDARALLKLPPGEATLLLTRAPGDAAALAARAFDADDTRVQALRARELAPFTAGEGSRWLVLRAPASVDVADLPRRAEAPLVSIAATAHASNATFRLATLPADAPWPLVPGGRWPDAREAAEGVAGAPNLVVLSRDLALELGLDPRNSTYAPVAIDAPGGEQTVYVMAVADDGPPSTMWAGAPLVLAVAHPDGARLLVRLEEGEDGDALARAWAPYGIGAMD